MKKNKKKGGKKSQEQYVLQYLQNLSRPTSLNQITKDLNVRSRSEKADLGRFLNDLVKAGQLLQVDGKKYLAGKKDNIIMGRVDHVNKKYAYIVSEDREMDVIVNSRKLNHAFDGDLVKVKIYPAKGGSKREEGEVTEIIERARTEFVGRIDHSEGFSFVIPDNRKIYYDFFVPQGKTAGAEHRDKVIIKVTKWPNDMMNPEAIVKKRLGKAGENEVEIHSIMAEFGLPFEFPKNVLDQASSIPAEIAKNELEKRLDFRSITTFTIDPEDAKDFDDALSFEFLPNGNYKIGVHIADVTHYVHPNTSLDREALRRATSVYLVDRTIPMLPERLSNQLCSLNPGEDKLTFSAVFEMDKEAGIANEWFGRTIIHSDKRFTYEQAQEVIETAKGDFADELSILDKLAKTLKKRRFKNGAINFETVEVKFQLDETGKPLAVVPKIRKDAHKLIEEFMLLANKRVAEFVYNLREGGLNTYIYRTHDNPDPEKLNAFANFARRFGYQLDIRHNISGGLNSLMTNIEGKPEQNVLESIAVRAMAKAKYTTDADPHFGLAFQHYSHFTSPIRRYPDMMAHRLLQYYLVDGKPADKEAYESKCEHCSEMEKRAADAERASIKFKQVEFMRLAEDKPYEGIISGVTEWGIYVEIIETKCEGMVRLSTLDDDYYQYDEDNYRVIGRNNKKMFTLGDKVIVKVVDTDIDRRTIDLIFSENE